MLANYHPAWLCGVGRGGITQMRTNISAQQTWNRSERAWKEIQKARLCSFINSCAPSPPAPAPRRAPLPTTPRPHGDGAPRAHLTALLRSRRERCDCAGRRAGRDDRGPLRAEAGPVQSPPRGGAAELAPCCTTCPGMHRAAPRAKGREASRAKHGGSCSPPFASGRDEDWRLRAGRRSALKGHPWNWARNWCLSINLMYFVKVGLHSTDFLQQLVPDLMQGHCFASWVAHVQFRNQHVPSLRGGRYFVVVLVVCFNCDCCFLVFAAKIKRLRNTAVKSPPSLMKEILLERKKKPAFCPVNHTKGNTPASALPVKYHLKKQNKFTIYFQPTMVLNVCWNSWFCSEFATCIACTSQLCLW